MYGRGGGENRNIQDSMRSMPRKSPPAPYRRGRSNYTTQHSTGRSGGNFRQITPLRNSAQKVVRPRKRHLNAGKRRSKRSRVSNKKNWSEVSKKSQRSAAVRLIPSTLTLVSGIPGKAIKHKFVAVKFQTHPFFRPRVYVNKTGESIDFEIVKFSKYRSEADRSGCEFSVAKQDIASIVAFVGDKVPEDISKKKLQPPPQVVDISDDETEVQKHNEVEDDINPDTMTGGQLRIELKKRKLESRGLKAELIRRLKKALAQEAAGSPKLPDNIDSISDKASIISHVEEEHESENIEVTQKNLDGFMEEDDPYSKVSDAQIESEGSDSQRVNEIHVIKPTDNGEETDAPICTEPQALREKWEIEEDSAEEDNVEDTCAVVRKVYDENEKAGQLSNPIDEVSGDKESEQDSEQEEFLLEDCYAYASGFRGKVGKKALMKAFGVFGTVIEMTQISKTCRIQYNTPAAVEKLIKCIPPLKFNGKLIKISRTLNPKVSETTELIGKEKEEPSTEGKINLAVQKDFAVSLKEEHDSEDEVETGRGGSEVSRTKKKTSWKKTAKKSSWKRSKKWKSKKGGKKWGTKKWTAKKWRGKKVKNIIKTKNKSSPKSVQNEQEDEIDKNDNSDKNELIEQASDIENVKESTFEENTEKAEKLQQDDEEKTEMSSDNEDDGEPDSSGVKEKIIESEESEGESEKVEEHEKLGEGMKEPTTVEQPENKVVTTDCVDKQEKLEEPEESINQTSDSATEVPEVETASEKEDKEPEQFEIPSEVETNANKAMDIHLLKNEIVHDSEIEDHSSDGRVNNEVDEIPKDSDGNTSVKVVNTPIITLTGEMKIQNEEQPFNLKNNPGLNVPVLDDLQTNSTEKGKPEKHLKALLESNDSPECAVKAGGSQLNENHMVNQNDEFGKSETKSYRVVISLNKGARVLQHSENLLKVEDLNDTRIFILEFAITSRNQKPKDIFTSAMEGPLKDVAHGEIWPESGPLSFKHTLTKVLSEMQAAREKERRAYGTKALLQENVQLKKKRGGFESEIKSLKEEANRLRKRIRTAMSYLK